MKWIVTTILLFAVNASAFAQGDMDAKTVTQLLENKNFTFIPQSVLPSQGQSRQLTPDYDLRIRPDSVISYLPYFGRAYTAPIDPSEGGIKFSSTRFGYIQEKKKKGRWEINITPKDAGDVQDLYLTVYENGRASLRVNSMNRQSISYQGYIEAGKATTKKAF